MTTPRSDQCSTARKRIITAAPNQRHPSPELERALNHYLRLTHNPLAPRAERKQKEAA